MSNHTYVPFRRRYPSGKLRDITKPEHTTFMRAVDDLMSQYAPLDDVGNGGWNVMTDYGVLRVHRGLDNSYGYCYSINGAFQDSSRYKEIGERFGTDHRARAINPYSGKWNILMLEGDDAIDELKERLALVGAKAILS